MEVKVEVAVVVKQQQRGSCRKGKGPSRAVQIKKLGPQSPRGKSPAAAKLVLINFNFNFPSSLPFPLPHSPINSSLSLFSFFEPPSCWVFYSQSHLRGHFDQQYAVKLSPDEGSGCLYNLTLSIERHILRLVPVGQSELTPPIERQILLRSSIVFVLAHRLSEW